MVISVSWKEFQKIDGKSTQHTSVQYSLFTSAERTPRAWLKSHGLQCPFCAPEKSLSSGLHMSHPCWSLLQLPFTSSSSSSSSSSFTLPSTTTQEHAAQPVQQDHLQEHPVHHSHLRVLPVDKQRHQESLWREDLQSGGNPRGTTPTQSAGETDLRSERGTRRIELSRRMRWVPIQASSTGTVTEPRVTMEEKLNSSTTVVRQLRCHENDETASFRRVRCRVVNEASLKQVVA